MRRLASLKHDRPSSKHRKFPKNGLSSTKLSLKDNLSFLSMLLKSQVSSQPLAKRLILNFFHQFFLAMLITGQLDLT